MMLSIGVIHGGPETQHTCLGQAITRLMQSVADGRGFLEVGRTVVVNVVFHIPGSVLGALEYKGFRDGKFSKKDKILMIQVAVPKQIADSEDEARILTFLFESLREANKIAAEFLKKKGIEYSQTEYSALVDAAEVKLQTP